MNWISVEDQMPDDLQQVDVLINGKRRVVDCTYEGKKFFVFPPICKEQWTEIKNNVTHWMPLPAPPTKYDWSNIPSWVEWIATSPDYKAWGFTHKPEICGDNNQDWGLRQEDSWSDVVAVSKFKGSWKDSLEQRPGEPQ